jgi:hypothetical protein
LPYISRDANNIQTILAENFDDFEKVYNEVYAKDYGIFRLERISRAVSKFRECGDWLQGIARIKCTNDECKHEYFRPFSCKQWYLCPSCHQKRLLLLAEHLSQDVMLRLPHRQFVFTLPKLLRPYFKHDRKLFSDVSKLIHSIISEYYNEFTEKSFKTGSIVSHQTYGDMMRFNPHWHCIIMEGGIDDNNEFYHIKIKDNTNLTEAFRKAVIKLFVDKELLNKEFALQFANWKNSGFSVDNSVFLFPYDNKAREGLCQYITRHPVSLKKITYEPVKKKVFYHTKYNEYWGENVKLFTASDFIADLTIHIPPKRKHMIRYYGIYASRTKGKSKQDGRYKKFRIKKSGDKQVQKSNHTDSNYNEVSDKSSKQSWARLIQKIYEVDPLVCPLCGSEMQIVAVIMDKESIENIINHMDKKRAPPEEKMVS